MKIEGIKISFLLFLTLTWSKPSHAQIYDSVFFDNVKDFIVVQFGHTLKHDYYDVWDRDTLPYFYVYVSKKDQIEAPEKFQLLSTGHNTVNADSVSDFYTKSGYSTFIYKTYATSTALLNKRLVSYPKEAICFILFHELMHSYVESYAHYLPYEFNEAVSDVIGNYGCLSCTTWNLSSWNTLARKQVQLNESLYEVMDTAIAQINRKAGNIDSINAACDRKIHRLLLNGNKFQNDRFDGNVNNGYLLKNSNYSMNYFLLKEVYLKQKSIFDFMQIITKLPADPDECRRMLRGYL